MQKWLQKVNIYLFTWTTITVGCTNRYLSVKRVHEKSEVIVENRRVLQEDIFIFEIDSAYYVQTVLHFYS